MQLEPWVLALLGLAGVAAGFVDAVAGGGGTIGVPALLAAGVPPVMALGTNKLQSVIGTVVAAITYWRGGFVSPKALLLPVACSFLAAMLGAFVVKQLDVGMLNVAVPIALVAAAIYFLLAPRLTDEDRHTRLSFAAFVPVMALIVGFYDGIFGPGTGSFLTIGFVALFGLGVTRAAGHTKFLNLASNLGALALFTTGGDILWPAAVAMAAGQVVGGYVGAHTGIRFGAKLIRPLIVLVTFLLAGKLIFFR